MKMISLFDGIGGFPLVAFRAGLLQSNQDLTVCEIDKQARFVTGKHFPGAFVIDDVRKVGKETHERKSVDLVCGGFPCQDLSVAGKRAGLAGERSGLWFEFARVIDELEPQWVVIENVPGLLSSNKGRDFAVILYWLVKRGYGVCWRVLDAQYFGVPQRRRRVFIVASFGNGRCAEVLFERESSAGDIESGEEISEGITTISGKSTFGTLMANASTKQWLGNQETFSGDYFVATTWTLRQGKEGGGKGYLGLEDKAVTLGGQQQYIGVRRLTPTECERLQGFPDGWTDGQSDSARYRQLGNAVAVPVVEWLLRRLKAAER